MGESSPRQLRVALISFLTGASGAGLLVWAIVGSAFDNGSTYFNLYTGLAVFLFLPSLFAGMVAALGSIAAMKWALRYERVPATVWAGLGAFVAYGPVALAVMWFRTQGLFPVWVVLVSGLVLGLVASAIVHLWLGSEARQGRSVEGRSHELGADRRVRST